MRVKNLTDANLTFVDPDSPVKDGMRKVVDLARFESGDVPLDLSSPYARGLITGGAIEVSDSQLRQVMKENQTEAEAAPTLDKVSGTSEDVAVTEAAPRRRGGRRRKA